MNPRRRSVSRRASAATAALLIALLAVTLSACSSGDGSSTPILDQCDPPGVDSATSVPVNLDAAAAQEEDRYTTATVTPLDQIDTANLGLIVPGVLTVGTLSDAPPSICVNSENVFTGYDNELLKAVGDKLGLRVEFVGTEFAGLLAQVSGRRFDVGSSSITT
ncbi:MAG: transporter substrate-binding domain-containing protein, partial [Rhodococcus sp.]|nr:transporter substrate-binding domain-containing protein [Rhodococcus sp. (in: high G+C Gram-positive bacteria)]